MTVPAWPRFADDPHGRRFTSRFLAIGAAHSTNDPCQAGVTATAALVAATATHRPPPRTWRFGWGQRVPMLYGTRLHSTPACLPRVSGLTRTFTTPPQALHLSRSRAKGGFG